ncbi:2-C-methyl-D-erythritol 4-phosphate cytidylyltransferase [Propioniciclava flava]
MSTDFIAEPVVAIVVAAGSGSRLGAAVPKALVPVAGVTLLRRSLTQLAAGGVQQAVVVVPAETAELFDADLLDAPLPVQRVVGGAQRQDSVAAGLAVLPDVIADAEALVLIHDAARAFSVPSDVVARVIDAVRSGADAAIPVVPVADTIREVDEAGSHVIDRTRLRGVQTPQGFRRSIIEAAHAVLSDTGTPVTDDAAAVEYTGHEVTLVAGDRLAFKVTEPLDVALAVAVAGGAA